MPPGGPLAFAFGTLFAQQTARRYNRAWWETRWEDIIETLKAIIDFDGTLTAEEDQAADLAERSITTLADELLHVPREQVAAAYAAARQQLLSEPESHGWVVKGLMASYCDEGAFLLNTATLQAMLRANRSYEQAVASAFPDAEYDPVVDATNYLFHRHTAELPPPFRPRADEVMNTLLGDVRVTPVILTNSMGDKVTRFLGDLSLQGAVSILGDTRQYDMDPEWTPAAGEPMVRNMPTWRVDQVHPIDLRRPVYYRALLDAARDGSRLAVVADTFSMPGALPLMMGIDFFLLRTPYTPRWCLRTVASHAQGHVLEDLADLPAALYGLLGA